MYLTILLLLLFLFLIKKNIEGYSDRIELDLVNNYLPPSSIGFGKCSVETVEDHPLCMNRIYMKINYIHMTIILVFVIFN